MAENPAIASRIGRIQPSATMAVSAAAKRMRAAGHDVIDLSVGEPDFPTPENICEAAKRAIDAGYTHYTQTPGLPELRRAIAEKLRDENDVAYDVEDVIVSSGAKHSIFNACAALLEPGDRVLIPAPYWVSYPEIVRFFDANVVPIETKESDGFRLTADLVRRHLAGAKMLFLNTPSNPTGAVIDPDELGEIAQMAASAGVWIISDEIYERLLYGDAVHRSVASFSDSIRERTLTINGVSKAYAMTGWRIGYMAGPSAVVKAASRLQSHSTSNSSSVAQMAAIEALTGPQGAVEEMRRAFATRRDVLLGGLREIPGWTCAEPGGAFYAFANVGASLGRKIGGSPVSSSLELATRLIEKAHVAAVPGEAFGAPGFVRFSYAAAESQLRAALVRIRDAVS